MSASAVTRPVAPTQPHPGWCDPAACRECHDREGVCTTHTRTLLALENPRNRVEIVQVVSVSPDGQTVTEPAGIGVEIDSMGLPVDVARDMHAALGEALALLDAEPAA